MHLVTRPTETGQKKGDRQICVNPSILPNGIEVACRLCWQCHKNRVNDYVGRCIAEQQNSTQTFAVTLTYEGNGPETAVLVYKGFQDFMKRLRKDYEVRYIVAGEYGSKKGRAHWHAVLFFKGAAPRVVLDPSTRQKNEVYLPLWKNDPQARIKWGYWSDFDNNGFAYFQRPDYGGFAYAMKYALKDMGQDVARGHLSMSKQPPLGHEYFQSLADRYVAQGLAPQDPFYSFQAEFDNRQVRRRFMMKGKTLENFCQRFIDRWQEKHGPDRPESEFIDEFEDKGVKYWEGMTEEETLAKMAEHIQNKTNRYLPALSKRERYPLYKSFRGVLHGFSVDPVDVIMDFEGIREIIDGKGQSWPVEDRKELMGHLFQGELLLDLYEREFPAIPHSALTLDGSYSPALGVKPIPKHLRVPPATVAARKLLRRR